MRGLAFLGMALLLAGPVLAAEPPDALAPYVESGALKAGEYGWVRGAFAGAGAEDKAAYHAIVAWREACSAEARSAMNAEVAALGRALPDDGALYGGSLLCRTAYPPRLEAFADFAELEAASARVKPLFDIYTAAGNRAEEHFASTGDTLGDQLFARTIGDQVLRRGLILATARQAPFAGLSDAEGAVLVDLFADAVMARDRSNTEWLKAHVAEHGWPTISEAGTRGAYGAWLIATHADLDPAFQLSALRLMEPLAATGEANSGNFVNLTDRVLLKLTGKQRYGTQLHCPNGTREPMPLEDPAGVDARRAAVGFRPLGDVVAQANERGPC